MVVMIFGVLTLTVLVLAVPTHGFHRRHSPGGRLEFIDVEKYFELRCQGAPEVSGPYDDFTSVFKYPESILAFAVDNGMSLSGYRSEQYAPYIIMDLDGSEAFAHAKILYRFLTEALSIPADAILLFFSGSRGMHFYIDIRVVGAKPDISFHLYLKEFCRRLAEEAGVVIDMAVYGPLQLVRSPNARHSKSHRYKTLLLPEELYQMLWEGVREVALQPRHSKLSPSVGTILPDLAKRWNDCVSVVNNSLTKRNPTAINTTAPSSTPRPQIRPGSRNGAHPFLDNFQMYSATLDFLINGATEGTRHTRLVAAAKNFADFGPGAKGITYALLFPTAFKSGLPEPEIIRVIESVFKTKG